MRAINKWQNETGTIDGSPLDLTELRRSWLSFILLAIDHSSLHGFDATSIQKEAFMFFTAAVRTLCLLGVYESYINIYIYIYLYIRFIQE